MIRKCLIGILFLFLALSSFVFAHADGDDFDSMLDEKINKMQKILNLTDSQALAVRPIIKDYIIKHEAIVKEVAGEGLVDHVAVKGTLERLKNREYQELSKVLTPEQMKKWVDRENLMATLNQGGTSTSVDDESSFSMEGANINF